MDDTNKSLILAEPWRIALQEMFDALPFLSKNSVESPGTAASIDQWMLFHSFRLAL